MRSQALPAFCGWIEHVALAVADLVRRAGPRREIAVARAIDKQLATNRAAARFGLDQQVCVAKADRERMKQQMDVRRGEQLIGDQLVRRDVVRLRLDASLEEHVRRAERPHGFQSGKDRVGNAMHDLAMLAVHLGMQAAEIRQARRRAGAAEKAVALDQDRGAPCPARRGGSGDARRAAAQHHHLVLGQQQRFAFGLGDEH